MIPKVTHVRPLPNYRLALRFSDGQDRVFDMLPYLDHGVFCDLRQPEVFNSVRVSFDTIEWNNGADLCPEVLYASSVPLESDLAPTGSGAEQNTGSRT